jgi:hypothetical protein
MQVVGNLTPEVRNKVISMITLDVHSRDVVSDLIKSRAENPQEFKWQSQLRYYFSVCRFSVMQGHRRNRSHAPSLVSRCCVLSVVSARGDGENL